MNNGERPKQCYGNDIPSGLNPFSQLYNIGRAALQFIQKNSNKTVISTILSLYYEAIFQIFIPITTLADLYLKANPPQNVFFNNQDIQEWAIKVGRFRNRRSSYYCGNRS